MRDMDAYHDNHHDGITQKTSTVLKRAHASPLYPFPPPTEPQATMDLWIVFRGVPSPEVIQLQLYSTHSLFKLGSSTSPNALVFL